MSVYAGYSVAVKVYTIPYTNNCYMNIALQYPYMHLSLVTKNWFITHDHHPQNTKILFFQQRESAGLWKCGQLHPQPTQNNSQQSVHSNSQEVVVGGVGVGGGEAGKEIEKEKEKDRNNPFKRPVGGSNEKEKK